MVFVNCLQDVIVSSSQKTLGLNVLLVSIINNCVVGDEFVIIILLLVTHVERHV